MYENGDQVVVLTGEYAGLTGIIGATYPDGRNEVLFIDSDLEVLLQDGDLELLTDQPRAEEGER